MRRARTALHGAGVLQDARLPGQRQQVVKNYSTAYGGNLVKISNGTVGRAPVPGDIVSFTTPNNPWGHVGVIAKSTVDANGNGTMQMMSQNDTSDGWRTLPVTRLDARQPRHAAALRLAARPDRSRQPARRGARSCGPTRSTSTGSSAAHRPGDDLEGVHGGVAALLDHRPAAVREAARVPQGRRTSRTRRAARSTGWPAALRCSMSSSDAASSRAGAPPTRSASTTGRSCVATTRAQRRRQDADLPRRQRLLLHRRRRPPMLVPKASMATTRAGTAAPR